MKQWDEKMKQCFANIVAVFSWLIMVAIIWFVEYKVYRRSVGANLDIILIVSALLGLQLLNKAGKEEPTKQIVKSKKSKIFDNIVFAIIILFEFYIILIKEPFSLLAFHFSGLLVLLILMYFVNKYIIKKKEEFVRDTLEKTSPWECTLVFTTISLCTIFFCLIIHPTTVTEGTKIVEKQGYADVEYKGNINDIEYFDYLYPKQEEKLSKREKQFRFYRFIGIKDGTQYEVAVSLYGHRVVGERTASKW